ncbi:MAG: hypothetical protein ACR2QO_25460 [Acidimicrobiales bacterium]
MQSTGRAVARPVALVFAFTFVLTACGSDDATTEATTDPSVTAPEGTTTSETSTSATTAEETTTSETSPPETTAGETAESSDTDASEAAGAAIPIELTEWTISDPGELAAGTLSFAVDNTGQNVHALAIARGGAYEDLPLKSNGAVDTDELGDDYLGSSDDVASGETSTVEFDLAAGDYVFFCPIEFGPNSHAGSGQVLSVSVDG